MQIRQTNKGTKSVNYTLPAPIGGLNARDSLDMMQNTDAVVMDNYYPAETKVVLRKGYSHYVSLNAEIETLAEYKSASQNRLLAFGNKTVFDVSTQAEVKNFEKNFHSNRWQFAQFKDRLICVNGIDAPQTYYFNNEEAVFEEASFCGTNLSAHKLVNIGVSKKRLFFAEKGSLNVWYSEGVGEVQGNLIKFDLSSLVRRGGTIQAIGCWTQDGGQGIDDLTVFLTSEGEVLVYSGSDPSNADDWTLKGSYLISKPLGYRCLLEYQGDLVVLTVDGYLPLSKALPVSQANASSVSFSDKIRGLVLDRTKSNASKAGWQGILYPSGGYGLFNVPTGGQFEQHIVNLSSGAWCRFTDILACCWSLYGNRLYFGSKQGVYLFDDGYSDNGTAIKGIVRQAYTDLGSPFLKKIQLINPRTKASSKYALVIYTEMDFIDEDKDFKAQIGVSGLTKWGTAPWGSKWATLRGKIRSQWIANNATGFKASVVFKTKTKGNLIEWIDTGFRYETGTGIL
jgi:hypothetical protein